jgi:hypothetical protein
MAQELQYIIRTSLDKADVKSVRDQLNALQASAQTPGGAKSDTDDETKAKKELNLALDDLTRAYLENAKALVELQTQSAGYKAQLGEIAEAKRANGTLTDEEARMEQALQTALKDTNRDYANQSREMIVLQQQAEATGESYFDIEKRMKALSVRIKSLDPSIAGNGEMIAKLTTEYNGLNKRLKEVDSTMGNHQRNVGDYENSIRSVANALAVFQGPLGPISGRINALATTLTRFQRQANAGSKSARILAGSIKLLQASILPLATIFLALFAYFKRTEEGAQALRVRMAGLKAMADLVIEQFVKLGEWLVAVWKEPSKALDDFKEFFATTGRAIVENLIERVRAVPKFWGAVFDGIVGTVQLMGARIKLALADVPILGAGIDTAKAEKDVENATERIAQSARNVAEAIKTVYDVSFATDAIGRAVDALKEVNEQAEGLERRMNQIKLTEREIGLQRAEQARDLQGARDLARDISASFEDRLEALAKVRDAENELFEREIANERERLEVIKAQVDMFKSSEEQSQSIFNQRAKIADLERASLERSMSMRRDENSLIRARNELLLREARRAIEAETRASNLRIAEVEREMVKRGQIVELANQKLVDFEATRVQEQKALQDAYRQELINQYGQLADDSIHFAEADERARNEILMRQIALRNSLLDAQEQRERAMTTRVLENERMARTTAFNDEIAKLQLKNDTIGILDAELLALREEKEREYAIRLQQMQDELAQQGILDTQSALLAEEALKLEFAEREAEIERRKNAQLLSNRRELMNATVALTKAGLTAVFGENKEVAIATAIIDTLAGINMALKAGPTAAIGFVNAAAIGAAGFANVRKIMSTDKDSKSTSSPNMASYSPSTTFGLVDLPTIGSLESQVASSAGGAQTQSTTIILDGEFDKEALAVKVRSGNDAISSRSISIGV